MLRYRRTAQHLPKVTEQQIKNTGASMNTYDKILKSAYQRDTQSQSQEATRASINHWFVRNHGVQRNSWPVTYEPTYHIENLQCPKGIDETYWDTLSQAEKIWNSEPMKEQKLLDDRRYWLENSKLALAEQNRKNQTNFYTQAIEEAVPFEEPLVKTKLALQKNVVNEIKKETNILQFCALREKWKQAGNW